MATLNLGPLSRIPRGEGRAFDVNGRAVAVFRTRGDELFATQALCPHQRGPLADGLVGDGRVVCPLHGFQFELATGRPHGNACHGLATYVVSVSESGDLLLADPGEGCTEAA